MLDSRAQDATFLSRYWRYGFDPEKQDLRGHWAMATQKHHDWMKTYFRMIGGGQGAAQPTAASAQSTAAGDSTSAPEIDGDDDQAMSLATEQDQGQSTSAASMSLGSPSSAAREEASQAEPAAQSANVLTFPLNVTTPKADFIKTTLGGGRFKVSLTASYQVQGTIEVSTPGKGEGAAENKNIISLFGANAGKYAASIGQAWKDEEGVKIFDLETAFTDVEHKATFEANSKELEIGYEAAGTLACGTSVSIKAVLLAYEGGSKGETKACAITIGTNIPAFKPKDYPIPGVKGATACGISLQARVEGTIEPEWEKIAKDVAEKIAERVGAEAAFDAGVTGGLVVAAFGVIPATFAQLIEGDDVESAGQVVNDTTNALTAGYRLGISGGQAPGDELAMLGYQAGRQVFEQGCQLVKGKVPDASDEVVKQWVAEWADKNQLVAKAHDEFQDRASAATWDRYATTYSSSRFYQMDAFSKIYPEKKGKWTDPLFTKYVKS